MKQEFKDQFYFTQREKRGIFLFLVLSFSILLYTYFQSKWIPDHKIDEDKLSYLLVDLESKQTQKEEQKLAAKQEREDNYNAQKRKWEEEKRGRYKKSWDTKKSKPKHQKKEINYFYFDPNTVSQRELESLGVKDFVAKNLIKFRDKGAVFRKAEDLNKVYGLDRDMDRLAPWVSIDQSKLPDKYPKSNKEKYPKKEWDDYKKSEPAKVLNLNINTATAAELMEIKGIGPTISGSIVKYRDLVGGYHSKEQLRDVYHMTDSTFQLIENQVFAEGEVKRININDADQEALSNHFLISFKQARLIVNYRRQHGVFQSVDDLKKIRIFNNEFIEKVRPYLFVD